jgi:hypothetical protein
VLAVILTGCGSAGQSAAGSGPPSSTSSTAPTSSTGSTPSPSTSGTATAPSSPATAGTGANGLGSTASGGGGASAGPRVFAYYYLWWSRKHWEDSLGAGFPYTRTPLPLPARLDAQGCNPTRSFPGVTVTDVPTEIIGQDDPGAIEADVRRAAAAGIAGFAVNWIGTGSPNQRVADLQYTRRLQAVVDAVHKVNAEGIRFSLWLSYKASVNVLPTEQILADLTWFQRQYGNDPAFDHLRSKRLTVIWNGSRKYPADVLSTVSKALRGSQRIIGDETTWSAQRAPYLDGDAYYWSSQNPWSNPQSFSQLGALAASVRSTGTNPDGSPKAFLTPLAPGYNKQLIGGSNCTPRKGGATLRTLFAGNTAATHPDDYALISWNEITEGTYVVPMQRWGSQELDVLRSLVTSR